jgi:hypothetical protein
MTEAAQAYLNKLEDADTNPPRRPKHITLQAAIAHAEREGWKNFDFGDCFYWWDWRTNSWKGKGSANANPA